MRLRWTPAAADDLEAIAGYLSRHFPSFTQTTLQEIYETIASLRSLPHRGRMGREEGTRELVIARLPYIVVYRIKAEAVEILHIYHGAQQRP
jgi:addiction module RelE/StbE family toxin